MPNSFAGPDQDPVMTQFDRLIAFIVYVLLFIGVFTFGVPSIVGLALAAALITWGEKVSGVSTATIGVSLTGQQAWIGGVMLATSVSLVLFGAAWTLLQSLFGFLRLAGNRPIGHTPVA